MSQTITNTRGETVEVLDKGDLNGALWKLIAFLMTAGAVGLWGASSAVADYRHDVEDLQAQVEENVPDVKALRRTMDSLLIELRATRRAVEAAGIGR